ncbi:ArsR/SmtB family transcription factor [Aquipuribacter sp. MA13-6]|uniref:ArsR/SmtB family transcription factor n=1 Tax=unclassified Aquipuribacter TaxID=2635084 RepID=UPI003EEA565F
MTQAERSELFDRLAVVGRALASPRRLEILDLLAQGERTVESLAREAGLGVSTTSAHLQILKTAAVVSTRRDGTKIHYGLAGDDVAALYAQLGLVARTRSADVGRALQAYLGTGSVDDVEQLSRRDLADLLRTGQVVVLDVRPAQEFDAGHIRGARSIPFGDLADALDTLPEDGVVAYCRGSHCVMASDAVRLLHDRGRRARRLEGGMLEWRVDGLPVEVTA